MEEVQLQFGGHYHNVLDLAEWVADGYTIEEVSPFVEIDAITDEVERLRRKKRIKTALVGGYVAMVDMMDKKLWLTNRISKDPKVQKTDLSDYLIDADEVARLRVNVLRYI